jgi:uncharacterized ubiquitin-like protein YukD
MAYKAVCDVADINGGVAKEQFQIALDEVLGNISNYSTEAKVVRKIVQTTMFVPSEDRSGVQIKIMTKTILAPVRADECFGLIEDGKLLSREPEKNLEFDLGITKEA